MIQGMHHTGITVRDLDRMVDFYTKTLGFEKLLEVDSVAPPEGNHTGVPNSRRKLVFVGKPGGHQIELVHYISPPASEGHLDKHQLSAMHVCFVVDDLDETYQQLSQQNVRFVTEPKYSEVDGRRVGVVYAQDPEDNWIEFIDHRV